MQRKKIYIGIFIVLIVLSMLLIIEDSFGITGRFGSIYRTCVDSDGGKNYNVAGNLTYTVRGNVHLREDRCKSKTGGKEKYVVEFFCNIFDFSRSYIYRCPSDICENGACVPVEPEPCDDSDNGLDFNVPGKTCSNDVCKIDLCLDDIYLSEAYCEGGIKQKIIKCEKGCRDGSCLSILNNSVN